jgi:hypothetical protein
MRTNPRYAQTPKQNTLMTGGFPGTRALIANRLPENRTAKRSGFGKITLQRADLKVPAQIGADALRCRNGT